MSREKPVSEQLRDEGFSFEFFQAVRLIEDLNPGAARPGENGPFAREAVRLRPSKDLSFPPGDLKKVECLPAGREGGRQVWRVTENIMGLYGANSPLPSFVSEMVAQAYQDDDPLRAFLDIFNHRVLSLYYRAWKKHHLAAGCDPTGPDKLTAGLCAMIGGRADAPPSPEWRVAPLRLARYAHLLGAGPRPAGALATLVGGYFGLEQVRVEPFLPRRVKLGNGDLSRLGVGGRHNRLGQSLVLGEYVQDLASQFRLVLGPLNRRDFLALQPGEPAYAELVFLVRLFTRGRLDFELELFIESEEIEPLRLSAGEPAHTLGRYSWLGRPGGKAASSLLRP